MLARDLQPDQLATQHRLQLHPGPGLVSLPQPGQVPRPGPSELRLLGQRVRPHRGDPPPAVEHRLRRREIELGPGPGQRLGELSLELGALVRDALGVLDSKGPDAVPLDQLAKPGGIRPGWCPLTRGLPRLRI